TIASHCGGHPLDFVRRSRHRPGDLVAHAVSLTGEVVDGVCRAFAKSPGRVGHLFAKFGGRFRREPRCEPGADRRARQQSKHEAVISSLIRLCVHVRCTSTPRYAEAGLPPVSKGTGTGVHYLTVSARSRCHSRAVIPGGDRKVPVLLGESESTRQLRADIEMAARSPAKVLLLGETGSGKEVAARLIHALGARQHGPFVAMNCSGMPEALFESEMFGHARGSFTGAFRDKPGRVDTAD